MLAAMNQAKDRLAYEFLTGKRKDAGAISLGEHLSEEEKAAAALTWAKEWKAKTAARWAGFPKPWPEVVEQLLALPN